MDIELLEKLGLTKNESKVYLTLLKLGITTTGPIMEDLGISSSRTYASLRELIKKGLTTYSIKNNVKYYKPESPNHLLRMEEELKEKLIPLVKELGAIEKQEKLEEYSFVFENLHGYTQAFDIILRECSPKEELMTIGFKAPEKGFETLRTFFKKMDTERHKKKIPMRILFDTTMKETSGKDREEEPYTKVKYLPKGYITPTAMSIFKDYVYIWVWKDTPSIFVIKNKQVSESFKNYFNLLWKIAEH